MRILKYKYEIAAELGISSRTLAYYLNVTWYNQLKELNYTKTQKLLLPIHIDFINKMFCVTD